jgi:hypothetical protein
MADEKAVEPTKYHSRLLDVVQSWLPVLTVVVGALWGLWTYIESQKAAEELRLTQAKTFEGQRQAQQKEADAQQRLQVAREANTRRVEAQKPFLTKQLELYFETAKVVGKIVTLAPARTDQPSKEYEEALRRFYALYWSELSMVEHKNVESAMVTFKNALENRLNESSSDNREATQRASLALAHAIRSAIESAWTGIEAPELSAVK